ncbi:hypothetical protein BDZ97DRAFT_1839603 [Flammula alnicola]|nr:hypothetical protein BDZ97DRAFT_1839603 [Flammula alnicola]
MDEPPPPADHILRPHHIALLTILMMAFKDLEIKKIISEITSGPSADAEECSEFKIAIKSIHDDINKLDKMANFLGIFGFFCRRCYLTFSKLSFAGLDRLCQDYAAWCSGNSSAGYGIIQKDELSNDLLLFKTHADRRNWAQPLYYEAWEKGQVVGDENLAIENLRRFFEQRFHESNDSGFRPHALLNLVRMHYIEGEYVAASKLLTEAINAARTSGDRITLHHCTRFAVALESFHWLMIQPDIHPLEVLFDVSKLLDEENDQPLNAAFIKIFQAVGLYDHWLDVQFALPAEDLQWAQHAVQSIVWREAGCYKVSDLEENIVLAFTEPGSESNTRLSIKARQGNYNEALALLIDPSVWRGLIVHDYSIWAHQIWHVLALRATRRGQLRLYRELLLPRRPTGPFNQKEYLFNQLEQATLGIEYLLQAVWHSEFLCRFNLYRTCIILLADIGLEFGMSKRSRQILEEIMPQVCQLTITPSTVISIFDLYRYNALSLASPLLGASYLSMAESDFQRLEMYRAMNDVQYMLSIVYHNLDMQDERQDAAKRHIETGDHQQKLEMLVFDEEILKIFDLLATVGDALASR